jgi:hypothetical protein
MMQSQKRRNSKLGTLAFWLSPAVLGLGLAQCLNWSHTVWLTTTGRFWPIVLTSISAAIYVKLLFSEYEDGTSRTAAWLTLLWTWFYCPLWAAAVEVPYSAAVVSASGDVHPASRAARYPEARVWLMTDRSDFRIVRNVAGKLITNSLQIEYRYADPYIGTRRHEEDLSKPLERAANQILASEAKKSRSSRIALIEDRPVQDRVLQKICTAAVGEKITCPLNMKLSPQSEATGLGATWSKYYTEGEAIDEKHLPTLVRLLTQPDSAIIEQDRVFALIMELAEVAEPLSQVAQHPHFLNDEQFDKLVARILISQGCGDEAVAILSTVNRLSSGHRQALRAKVLSEATISKIVAHATALRLSDAEIAQIASRMQSAFLADPGLAVRALQTFGDRLPPEAQRHAVKGIVKARASHALTALAHVNFSDELRHDLMKKVLSNATPDDFSDARMTKESLQAALTPTDMRALIAVAVKRSEASGKWLEFALTMLPIRAMMMDERRSLLTGSAFESPKAALEFVSKNRRHLDRAEVNEVTRDYTRTITTDFCLHLSHRNKNWRTEYFSEDQLQIFRECADSK